MGQFEMQAFAHLSENDRERLYKLEREVEALYSEIFKLDGVQCELEVRKYKLNETDVDEITVRRGREKIDGLWIELKTKECECTRLRTNQFKEL